MTISLDGRRKYALPLVLLAFYVGFCAPQATNPLAGAIDGVLGVAYVTFAAWFWVRPHAAVRVSEARAGVQVVAAEDSAVQADVPTPVVARRSDAPVDPLAAAHRRFGLPMPGHEPADMREHDTV